MLCKSVRGVYKVDVTEVVTLNLPCMSVCNECSLERELETSERVRQYVVHGMYAYVLESVQRKSCVLL